MAFDLDSAAVFDQAAALITEVWTHHGPASEMHIGDLAWGTFHCWPNALGALRLWRDETGQAQALTKFDGVGVCDLVVRPGDAGLNAAANALDWAEALGQARGDLRVGRRVQSAELVDLLQERGFVRRSGGVPAMSRTLVLADVASAAVPSGYLIRELVPGDLVSRVAAFNAAFPAGDLSVDAYHALRSCTPYISRLDVVAASSSSDVVAFATLWLDPENAVVQIEPAGCHPSHRRLGLTRAVILHALRRSVELGAASALVRHVDTNTAAKALYESCGFATVCEETGFVKSYRQDATSESEW